MHAGRGERYPRLLAQQAVRPDRPPVEGLRRIACAKIRARLQHHLRTLENGAGRAVPERVFRTL